MKLCPTSDELWFWAMAVLNGTKINVVENNISEHIDLNPDRYQETSKATTLWQINKTQNPILFQNILEHYPGLKNVLLEEKSDFLNVCFFSSSAQLGDAEKQLLELVTILVREHGVICTVVLPAFGPLSEKLSGIAWVIVAGYSNWCDTALPSDSEITRSQSDSLGIVIRQLLPELRTMDVDVVFTNTVSIPWGAVTASFLGKPHVWSVNNPGDAKFYVPFEKIQSIIKDASDIIFTDTQATGNTLFGKSGFKLAQNKFTKKGYSAKVFKLLFELKNKPARKVLDYSQFFFDLAAVNELTLRSNLIRIYAEFEERTAWALKLDKELAKTREDYTRLQKEFEERTAWALQLDQELNQLRSKH